MAWDTESLRQHLILLVDDHRRLVEVEIRAIRAAVEAAEKATNARLQTASEVLEHRLASLNELRGVVTDAARRYATREGLEALDARVDALASLSDTYRGERAGQMRVLQVAVAVVGLLATIAGFLAFK